jgi:hypothetical protein
MQVLCRARYRALSRHGVKLREMFIVEHVNTSVYFDDFCSLIEFIFGLARSTVNAHHLPEENAMKSHATDGPEALARILALSMIVDGHVSPSELRDFDGARFLQRPVTGADHGMA